MGYNSVVDIIGISLGA